MHLTTLIPLLIRQDMKHYQFLHGLEQLGLDPQLHHLEIQEIVAQLMGIEEGMASNQWCDTYMHFLDLAALQPITSLGENLQELAEDCYLHLQSVL